MATATEFSRMLDDLEEYEQRQQEAPFFILRSSRRDNRRLLTKSFLSSMSADQVDQLITACLRRRCYMCLVVLGIHLDILSRVLGQMPDLGRDFWAECMGKLGYRQHSALCEQIVSHFPMYDFSSLLISFLPPSPRNEENNVFKTILERSAISRFSGLDNTITYLVFMGFDCHLELAVYSSNANVRRAVGNFVCTRNILGLLSLVNRKKPLRSRYNACLCVTCEAGLFTAATESTAQRHLDKMKAATYAVEHMLQGVVEYLYSVGMMDNHTVFQLCGNEELHKLTQQHSERDNNQPDQRRHDNYLPGQAGEDNTSSRLTLDSARRIREFLFYHASHPRSLETLCLLEVCRHIGWGHNKKTALDEFKLELAPVLKERIMFKGCRELLKP